MPFPRYIILFDMFLCALFAVPGISDLVIHAINSVNAALDLPGGPISLSVGTGFFVNFGGLLGVCFNLALLDPKNKRLHWFNIGARILVILLVFYHIAASDLPMLFVAVAVTELFGGLMELRWLRSQKEITS